MTADECNISTHTPREGRDASEISAPELIGGISTHTPREGRDKRGYVLRLIVERFQLTRPARGATSARRLLRRVCYISTHTPREGRDVWQIHFLTSFQISTHTPREGRDISCGTDTQGY